MTASGDMNKNMGKMETSITDLQGELNVANEPSKNHFKPGWLLIAFVVAAIVGGGTFFATTRFVKVDDNSESIKKSCQLRNEELQLVNAKFEQLGLLFDKSIEDRSPNEPPLTEETLKLYRAFRVPIRLLDCENKDALKASESGVGERAQWTTKN